MQTYVIERPRGPVEIEIPETARDWELYTDMRGSTNAARGMVAALKRSFAAFPKLLAEGHQVNDALNAAACIRGGISEAMERFADHEAADTEPRNHAYDAMERFVLAHLFGTSNGGGAVNGTEIRAGF